MSVASLERRTENGWAEPQAVVRARLASARRQLRSELAIAGVATLAASIAAFAIISFALDYWLRFDVLTRPVLGALSAAVLIAVAWTRVIRPLAQRLPDRDLAGLLERKHVGLAQHVATVYDLPRLVTGRVQASPSMVRAAVEESSDAVSQLDLAATVRSQSSRRYPVLLFLLLLAPALGILLRPDLAELWAARWLAGSSRRWPQDTYLSVVGLGKDGVLRTPRGEPFTLEVTADPSFVRQGAHWQLEGRPVPLEVNSAQAPRSQTPRQISVQYRIGAESSQRGNFTDYGGSRFRFDLPAVTDTTWIAIRGGDDWIEPFRLEPIDRPHVARLELIAKHARQERGAARKQPLEQGQVVLLGGTELVLNLEASEPLSMATLVAKSGPAIPLARRDARSYAASWRFTEPQTMELRMKSQATGLESLPRFVSLGLQPDRPPRVSLRSQGVGRRITPQARVPLEVEIYDDFGLATAALEGETSRPVESTVEVKTESDQLELPAAAADAEAPRELQSKLDYLVAAHGLAPGTAVRLRAVASDNAVDASSQGESRWLAFQIVSPEELFYDLLVRQRQLREKFRQTVTAAEGQSAKLAGPLTEEQRATILRVDRVIARDVWQVTTRLDASLTEMTLNELGSSAARELLATNVIAPLQHLHSETLPQLHAALAEVQADVDNEARQAAAARQGEVVTEMKRILAQMSQWESFVDVVNQLREVIKLQEGVRDSAKTLQDKKTDELFEP